MKTILGLIGGGDRDEIILRTALAAAVPLLAHLDFLHIHVSAAIAAQYGRVDFALGAALCNALDKLKINAATFSKVAEGHVREFCAGSKIQICDGQTEQNSVTASFREEKDATIERLVLHARDSDFVVLGRAKQTQGLSPHTLEYLVRNCGRPVLVAATSAPRTLVGTVMVCWNKSDNAARAITAAAPILAKAKRIVFVNVAQCNDVGIEAIHDLTRQFASHGISAEVQIIPAKRSRMASVLSGVAEDCRADLVVMGAYGRSRMRELVFGSCTEMLIRNIDRPLLLMH
jgi:nucleotide-binding universal stress UspA family protein